VLDNGISLVALNHADLKEAGVFPKTSSLKAIG
jgi:hypothetical protein